MVQEYSVAGLNNNVIKNHQTDHLYHLPEESHEDLSPVQKFYEKSHILITGATGFLGKILVEKLLRSCPTLSTLYLVVRSKKNNNLEERLDKLFEDVVFDRLKKECPKYRHKIVGISGDGSLPGLGLSIEDRKRITEQVDIIFHVAATVRFDEKLKNAVAINVRCPMDLIKLAKETTNLKAFMHVSTIYAHCLQRCIEEKIYPPVLDPYKLMMLTELVPEPTLDDMTPKLLQEYPNTYTYTKQIAESVITEEAAGDVPLGIFRPAIVISTYKEPSPGWINNLYGPTGVFVGAGVGLLRTLHCNRERNANLVPVDMCVNSLIVAAKEVSDDFLKARDKHERFQTPVYNYGSTNEQPLTWGRFQDLTSHYGIKLPTIKAIWYYYFHMYKYYPVYLLFTFLLHTVPALLADGVLLCLGKKPRMMEAYKKVHKFCTVISYFSTREWKLQSDKVVQQQKKLQEKDKEIFFSDLTHLDWDEFMKTYCIGARLHLLGDPLDNLEAAQVKWKKLYFAHMTVKMLFYAISVWFSYWVIKVFYY